jgi:branched-chain amino acid transport system permease protein
MIGQPLIAVLMMTLALLALLKGLSLTVWGADPHSLPSLFPEKPLVIGDIVIPQVYLWSFVAGLMVFGMLELFFKYARVGLAARSVCDSEQAALSVGVDVPRVYSYVWIISCVVAAVGGIFLASMLCVVPLLSDIGLLVIPVVVLGGLESIAGALIAGVIIGVTESLSGGYLETFFPAVKLVIPYVILLIVLIIKPYGLFGLKRIERV